MQITVFDTVRKMPKRQPRSRNEETDNTQFDPSYSSGGGDNMEQHNTGNYGDDNNSGGGGTPLAGPSNIRQGGASFQCESSSNMSSSSSVEASQSKSLAMSVALSICQGLHGWAETSDFNKVLQKLRHLLCLVNEHGDNALHSAIIHQQKEPFLQILETLSSFPDTAPAINEPNHQSQTPLHLAVLSNRVDFVTELLRHNADISIQNSEGDTPLSLAVKGHDYTTVKTLLQSPTASAAINKFNYSSLSPLLIAVSSGDTALVELLCASKASLTAQEGTFGRTPLHMAVEKETKESIISTMIILKSARENAGDLTNIQNYRGDSPLHTAAANGFTTMSALLMHYGADPMVENHVRKETEHDHEDENEPKEKNSDDDDDDERLSGQTVFDVTYSDQVFRVLKGTLDDWEIILKACSPLLLPSNSPPSHLLNAVGGGDKDKDFESKCLDSGIDVNTFNSSQFLNSSSSNQL